MQKSQYPNAKLGLSTPVIPAHIGFIVDGNRRWAREKGLPTLEGHRKGLKKVESIIEAISESKIPYATFYLFSTENWSRSKEEVSYLMALASERILSLGEKARKNNQKVIFLSTENNRLDKKLKEKFKSVEDSTKNCTSGTIALAFNYGGREEIADAAKKLSEKNLEFTPENIEKNLYHPEIPPLDIIVRTSGEERLSGFMLWRAAYAEFLFLKKYWPDIEKSDLKNILKEFKNRSRRFGK